MSGRHEKKTLIPIESSLVFLVFPSKEFPGLIFPITRVSFSLLTLNALFFYLCHSVTCEMILVSKFFTTYRINWEQNEFRSYVPLFWKISFVY